MKCPRRKWNLAWLSQKSTVAVFSATGESLPSRNKWLKAEDCTRQPPIELFSVVLNAACYKWKDLSYELRLSPGVLCCPFLCLNGEAFQGHLFRCPLQGPHITKKSSLKANPCVVFRIRLQMVFPFPADLLNTTEGQSYGFEKYLWVLIPTKYQPSILTVEFSDNDVVLGE